MKPIPEAEMFGVSIGAISHIKNNRTWRGVL
jgi:hypothetical protein